MKSLRILIIIFLFCALVVSNSVQFSAAKADTVLGCISLRSSESLSDRDLASAFNKRMTELGYECRAAYCDNDIITQKSQLSNFIAMGADIIAVDRVGDSVAYDEVFELAHQSGCIVIVLDSAGRDEYCDIWVKGYNIALGLRACELISRWLDEEYPDAPAGTVDALLLESGSTMEDVQIGAGYRLLTERFLRYYDVDSRDFICTDGNPITYYRDEQGTLRLVKEPTGGLILDENGRAQLNPFYDERVVLHDMTSRDVASNLDAQAAVDAFMAAGGGGELRIVICTSPGASVGAAERLEYYYHNGLIDADYNKLAVFGYGNNSVNQSLLRKSFKNQSLLRGYVDTESASSQIYGIVDMVLSGSWGAYIINSSSRSCASADKAAIGMATIIGSDFAHPDIFFMYSDEEAR